MKKLITLVVLFFLVLSVNAQKGVSVPYHEDFESAQCENSWHTYNENNDDGEWFYADIANYGGVGYQQSSCFMYIYSSTEAGNDWLVSPGFALNSGNSYSVSIKYAEYDALKTEKLKIFISNDSLPSSFSELLLDNDALNSTTFNTGNFNYTPTNTGTFYIGLMAYSDANQGALLIDEFNVSIQSSINDNSIFDKNVIVFPNPVSDLVVIKNGASSVVSIIDVTGKVIYSGNIISDEQIIDLKKINKGVYFLQFNKDGFIKTQKLIVN
jgi:hypothetical protein